MMQKVGLIGLITLLNQVSDTKCLKIRMNDTEVRASKNHYEILGVTSD